VILSTTIPIRTVNEANGSHGSRWEKSGRRKKQRQGTVAALNQRTVSDHALACRAALVFGNGLTIALTRIAPSAGLDDDAIAGSMKSVRDGVTDWLGLTNDRDPRLAWRYAQIRGEWGVRIQIDVRGQARCPTCGHSEAA
jgi:hypothetical protein